MTRPHRIAVLLVAAALAACSDRSPNPVAPPLQANRVATSACPGLGDGCHLVSDVIDVGAVDVSDSYIESRAGARYYVSSATQFLPVALPPNPIIPTDPLHATVISWNALVESRSSYRSFLGQLRQLPPNPVLPPSPIFPTDPVRFRTTALFDGASYFLTSLQPSLVDAVGP